MGFKAMTWASSLKTGSPTKKLILLMLADRANDEGFCWPSTSKIAEDCELRRETVSRNIKEMERDGILHVQKHENGGKYKNNIYYLHVTQDHSPCEGGSHDHVSEDHTNLSIEPEKEPCAPSVEKESSDKEQKTPDHVGRVARKFVPPKKEEVQKWAREWAKRKGENMTMVHGAAMKGFEYYDRLDWKDSRGHAIKSWKQKITAVWFKEETFEEFRKKADEEAKILKECGL